MQPYNNSKHSLFATQTKGQYVSFQPSETYHPHEIFPELKFSCKNLYAFVKTHKNLICPKLISFLFYPPAVSAMTPESLSGQKMAGFTQSFCLMFSGTISAANLTDKTPVEKSWNSLKQNGQHGKKALSPSCFELGSRSNNPVQEPSLKQGEAVWLP